MGVHRRVVAQLCLFYRSYCSTTSLGAIWASESSWTPKIIMPSPEWFVKIG